ncbi:beta-lactamase-like protein [Lipomyces arxii]|uniref:beta-lactamase-like protein n=1 Tax=Lipomyces arxii TaxID=56418 RepID=UPI0034CD6BFF
MYNLSHSKLFRISHSKSIQWIFPPSTFKGIPHEFPDIRIDYFRYEPGTVPPKACFLSHVHVDHLQGLDGSYGGPFIYCSIATKRLLLRIEKRRSRRMKLVEGLDVEFQRTYRHLGPDLGRDVLREIPYNTPTDIQLDPKRTIRVTLFDANHCPGSTMFLIESETTTILYTGDIRAEPWWNRKLAQNSTLNQYCHNNTRKISTIYLDTTFCSPSLGHSNFPTKMEGASTLIARLKEYPDNTVFYFDAWTYGYEELWILLSSALGSAVHVDKIKYHNYRAIREFSTYVQGPKLAGSPNNAALESSKIDHGSEGCLTLDSSVQIHSCERGFCTDLPKDRTVYIIPCVNYDVAEPGSSIDFGM